MQSINPISKNIDFDPQTPPHLYNLIFNFKFFPYENNIKLFILSFDT